MSFKKMPGRAAFKRVGRAFSFGFRMVAPGFGIKDLSRGKKMIEHEIRKQGTRNFSSNFCCIK